jgi:hypothetical protein
MIPKPFLPKIHGLCGFQAELSFVFPREIWFKRMHNFTKVTLPGGLNNQMEMIGEKDIFQQIKRMEFFDVVQSF